MNESVFFNNTIQKLLYENEVKANRLVARTLLLGSFVILLIGLYYTIIRGDHDWYTYSVYASTLLICLFTATETLRRKGEGALTKHFLLTAIIVVAFILSTYTVYGFQSIYVLAIILSCRYYDSHLTFKVSLICLIACILTAVVGTIAGIYEAYLDVNAMDIKDGVLKITGGLTESLMHSGFITRKAVINQALQQLLFSACIVLVAWFISYFVASRGREMMNDIALAAAAKNEADKKAHDMQTNIMISQIQPHFLYNALTAIMAIDGNPVETTDAIADFGKYLRENLNVLKSGDPIPFKQELEHTKRYLALEKLRFKDKIHIEWNIKAASFNVPPLSVQMLVENAIKHGITQRTDGGYVWISSEKLLDDYIVTIRDNGVGFDTAKPMDDPDKHIGLASVKNRIEEMSGGTFVIQSEPGVGTVATIRIPVNEVKK